MLNTDALSVMNICIKMAQPTNQGQENTEKQSEQFILKYLINHLV